MSTTLPTDPPALRSSRPAPRASVPARVRSAVAEAYGRFVRPWLPRARKILGVVSPLGWTLVPATAIAGIVGLWLGWWELIALFACGVAILAVCVLFLIGRTEYAITLDLARERVVVGERAMGQIALTNPGRRPLLPSRVILPVGRARPVFEVPRLTAGQTHEELFVIPTTRRAVLQVGPVSAVRGDPLGLFERTHAWTTPTELYVHPRTVRLDGASAGTLRDLEGLPTRDLSRDDVSFHALREYTPGDDLRHVHWRSTARTGTVMVRQYEDTRRSQTVVLLSRAAVEYADEDEFELAVSVAGSVALQGLREGRDVSVLSQQTRIPSRGGRVLLDALSAIETGARLPSVDALAASIASTAPQASIVVLVTGSRAGTAVIQRAARRAPAGSQLLSVVCRPQEKSVLSRTGGARVLHLSQLPELSSGMRRALT